MTNVLVHQYHLDESTFRDTRSDLGLVEGHNTTRGSQGLKTYITGKEIQGLSLQKYYVAG